MSGQLIQTRKLKGVRSQLYWYADHHIGYYNNDGHPAIYYDDQIGTEAKDPHLKFHIIFETKENALHFESAVRQSATIFGSPMKNLPITTKVEQIKETEAIGDRILHEHYNSDHNKGPTLQNSERESNSFSLVDYISDEFKFQRIEDLSVFSSFGKSLSCHLMSKKHCLGTAGCKR